MTTLDGVLIGGCVPRLPDGASYADADALADALVGETVTMMLSNGTVISGVRLVDFRGHNGLREFGYNLATCQATSRVPTPCVMYVFVHYPAHVLDRPGVPWPVTVYVGECKPVIRA